MSVNSTSSFNNAFECAELRFEIMFIGFAITKALLLLPVSIFILCLGHQRWRQQRSFATTSHSDIFTFEMIAVELTYVLGGTLFPCSRHTRLFDLKTVGFFMIFTSVPGQMGFHILTCVERYLAVVHPVTYMRLKQSGGVRIRNISSVCVWLLSFGAAGVVVKNINNFNITLVCLLVVSLIVVSFCSLRVLCVLIRPGPGEVGGDRERVDQSKQRAFHTIMAITGVLWLWFVGFIICLSLRSSDLLSYDQGCVVVASAYWFSLPSSLVLPVLFLHRAGKLLCCCRSSE